MNYTWGEIQILSIQKMFLNNTPITVSDLSEMRDDKKYKLYLNMMPSVANEGLLRLMSIGKPLIKKYTLNHNVPSEILNSQSYETYNIIDEDLVVYGSGSQSYYFEIDNQASIEIQVLNTEWETIQEITHIPDIINVYTVYKGLIKNDDKKPVRIIFKGEGFSYNVRYIALYNINFRTDEEVFNNTLKQKYNLKNLISDFFEIVSVEYEGNNKIGQYNSDFILEGDNILVIDTKLKGNFIITYKAYPDKITVNTSDNYRFNMSGEMIALLPLYIASELYKDDDISLATVYRNQFETGLLKITNIEQPLEFANNSGWL